MSKKFFFMLWVLGLGSLVPGPVQAQETECMTAGGKFVPCRAEVVEAVLSVRFTGPNNRDKDVEIPAGKIQRVTQGRTDQHNVQQSLVLGPLMFWSMFDREKKAGEMFGIDYLDPKGKMKYLLIRIPPDQVYTFGTSLRKLREPTR